jgi:hypothetical protein
MLHIKGSHIAIFASGTCVLLIATFFVVDTLQVRAKYLRPQTIETTGEETPDVRTFLNSPTRPKTTQATTTESATGDKVIRIEEIDIVANSGSSWLDERYPQAFYYEAPPSDEAAETPPADSGVTGEVTTPEEIEQKEQQLLALYPQLKTQVEQNRSNRTALTDETARLGMSPEQYALENEVHLDK